jgi:S-adenosylmethionine:tRNA ribosyltransferase-isomerase
VQTRLFDYELPEALIARYPSPDRDGGRLLVLGPGGLEHRRIRELPELVAPGSLVIVNDSRVRKARLLGKRAKTGGAAEVLLLRPIPEHPARRPETWLALGRASKALRPGTLVEAGSLRIEVLERHGDGFLIVAIDMHGEKLDAVLEREGHVPIPPYLGREDEAADSARYQTVYARHPGSVAAPTAGLHLTENLIGRLENAGIEIGRLTLHVGPGTFRPVVADDLDQHPMHGEWFEIDETLAARVELARERRAPVVAIGTTVVRALESAADPEKSGHVRPMRAETELLIQPGYRFKVTDQLLTNFHLPKSTLLALVSAFAGRERILEAYRTAIGESYRFLSYGDAMWITERAT